jgi:Na+-driven multidrug efflux pump
MGVALQGVIRVHDLLGRFRIISFIKDLGIISRMTIPAMLTNVATPIGNAYVITSIAQFGDGAVAGMSIVGRITPVAFGIVFALSGAVGPIIGQNFGAKRIDRVTQTIKDALLFSSIAVIGVSVILFLVQDLIITGFQATTEASILISLFCTWIAITFLFNGSLFIANATLNNLGYPHYATFINFTKATLGTIPFVYFGAILAAAPGVLIGQAAGTVIVGSLAIVFCLYMVRKCSGADGPRPGPRTKPFNPKIPIWPQSNTRG